MKEYYKLAQPNGFDYYSGKTINYRESIGKWVSVPKENLLLKPELCTPSVIHASTKPLDCFIGVKSLPCSAFRVRGNTLVEDNTKGGFKKLFVIKEIPQETLDNLFGFKYLEASNPIHPFKIKPPTTIGEEQIKLLQKWDSVRAYVGASVEYSVRDSVRDSVGAYVGASVGASVEYSVRDSVGDSVGYSVRDSAWASVEYSVRYSVRAYVGASAWASVRDSVGAYVGSLFPNIKKWKYIEHEEGVYPFQPSVDLWKQGLVPSFDGKVWRLHGGEKATILYEVSKEDLMKK